MTGGAQLLRGEPIAALLRAEAEATATVVRERRGQAPRLVIIASADPSAVIYAAKLQKDAAACGIDAIVAPLALDANDRDAASLVGGHAADPLVDAVLLQTPLPPGIDPAQLPALIPPSKDIDGVTLECAGAAALGRRGAFFPATAAAVLEILKNSSAKIEGAHAVVLGRSAVVGRPAAFGLIALDATVTIAHSKTVNLKEIIRSADVLVAAVGKPALVEPDWIRPGATVVDVGIHRMTDAALAARLFKNDAARLDAFSQKGSAIIGDCHPECAQLARAITPVPGGVGPVTSAILLKQTAAAAHHRL